MLEKMKDHCHSDEVCTTEMAGLTVTTATLDGVENPAKGPRFGFVHATLGRHFQLPTRPLACKPARNGRHRQIRPVHSDCQNCNQYGSNADDVEPVAAAGFVPQVDRSIHMPPQ